MGKRTLAECEPGTLRKSLYISKYVSKCMAVDLSCKCGHNWTYKGKSEYYATCPRCHNLVNVKKAKRLLDEKKIHQ